MTGHKVWGENYVSETSLPGWDKLQVRAASQCGLGTARFLHVYGKMDLGDWFNVKFLTQPYLEPSRADKISLHLHWVMITCLKPVGFAVAGPLLVWSLWWDLNKLCLKSWQSNQLRFHSFIKIRLLICPTTCSENIPDCQPASGLKLIRW